MSVACAGFIIAGADKNIRWGRKKVRWGRITPGGLEIFFPPAELNSAPGAEQARGGGAEKGRNI